MRIGHHVYILTNKTQTVFYIGCTGFLEGRLFQHREKLIEGFTKKYQATNLIYYETFPSQEESEKREKQLKGWTRAKKLTLIRKVNPLLLDLSYGMMEKPGFNPLLPASDKQNEMSRDPSTPAGASAQD